ncbi:MAG: GspMb/PilO family protein [Candidatus Omnitrophica bacterium]|nr:GspMb/PilO family protein [Candidatus Omnitrophota bacterium]
MQRIISKREKLIFYLTVAIIIFSLIFNFLLAPVFKKNELLNRQITTTRAKLKKYLWLLNQKEAIQNNKYTSGAKLSLSEKDTLVDTLAELENLAKDANIRIVDIRPQTPRSLDLYKEIIIDVRAEGSLDGYIKFIYSLENSLSLLEVKKLDLNTKPNSQLLEGAFTISQLAAD